jgi:hypothetical protein
MTTTRASLTRAAATAQAAVEPGHGRHAPFDRHRSRDPEVDGGDGPSSGSWAMSCGSPPTSSPTGTTCLTLRFLICREGLALDGGADATGGQ